MFALLSVYLFILPAIAGVFLPGVNSISSGASESASWYSQPPGPLAIIYGPATLGDLKSVPVRGIASNPMFHSMKCCCTDKDPGKDSVCQNHIIHWQGVVLHNQHWPSEWVTMPRIVSDLVEELSG